MSIKDNPYSLDRTLARVWEEGRAKGYLQGIQEEQRSDDEAVLIQMGPSVGSLDGMKWVGVVPDDKIIRQETSDRLEVEYLTSQGNWLPTTPPPVEDISEAWAEAIYAARSHRKVRIVYRSTTNVGREVGSIEDGVETSTYGEHEQYKEELGL